jgi:DNA invertase Pin-like site-specific DNA recombinase
VRAAAYARVSEDRGGDAASVEEQLTEIRRDAERRGWEVAEEYVDRGVSASRPGTRRPGYLRLLDDVRAGKVTRLLVYMTDRLYRQPRELEDLIDLVEARHVDIGTVRSGDLDLSTPEGRAFARNSATWNKLETEKLSERLRRTKASRREQGILNGGGRRPFGYDREPGRMKVNRREARVIREMADRVVRGDTLYSVITDLNRRRIRTASGKRWSYAAMRSILLGNPLGEKRGTPLVAGGANWPRILDDDTLALVRSRWPVTEPGRARPVESAILAGVVRCSECGQRMHRSGGYYRCNRGNGGCGRTSVRAEDLERLVLSEVAEAHRSGRLEARLAAEAMEVEAERQALLGELRQLEDRRAEVAEEMSRPGAPVRTLAQAATRVERDIADKEREIRSLSPVDETVVEAMDVLQFSEAGDEVTHWPADDDSRAVLRSFVRTYVEAVEVQPGRGNVPERVEVVWR